MTAVQQQVLAYFKLGWRLRYKAGRWIFYENLKDADSSDPKRKHRGARYNVSPRTLSCLIRDGYIGVKEQQ